MSVRILALEPYYGGSHRAVLAGLSEALARNDPPVTFELLTMPARKWKWRMRGSAIVMAARAREAWEAGSRFDAIFASSFVNLAEFKALAGPVGALPAAVYFHENQLVYPNRHTEPWDLQFPLTNVVSALAADLCVFNTRFNLDGFLDAIPGFFKQFPDNLPRGVAPAIEAKSEVLAPPFDPAPFDAVLAHAEGREKPRGTRDAGAARKARRGPRIVWPHRWEHDKDPAALLRALERLAREGADFEVAVAGQEFRDRPIELERARETLGERLVHCGEPASRRDYAGLLAGSDIAVSTAVNEFFGIAMVEACYAGCYPVVPDRLAYRELYPAEFRYPGASGLVDRLRVLVADPPVRGRARHIAEPFTLERLAPQYADLFARLAAFGDRRASGLS